LSEEKTLKERLIGVGRKEEVEYIENMNDTCITTFIDRFTKKGKEIIMDEKELVDIAQHICLNRLMPIINDILYENIPFDKIIIGNLWVTPILEKLKEDAVRYRDEYRYEVLLSAFRKKEIFEQELNEYEKLIWEKFHPEKLSLEEMITKFILEHDIKKSDVKKINKLVNKYQKIEPKTRIVIRGKSKKGIASGIIANVLGEEYYKDIMKTLNISKKSVIESNKKYIKNILLLSGG